MVLSSRAIASNQDVLDEPGAASSWSSTELNRRRGTPAPAVVRLPPLVHARRPIDAARTLRRRRRQNDSSPLWREVPSPLRCSRDDER